MQKLLATLKDQTYLLSTSEPLIEVPELAPWVTSRVDSHTFELRVEHHITMNDIFLKLNDQNITIQSLRNKNNRLEELFMDIIHDDN